MALFPRPQDRNLIRENAFPDYGRRAVRRRRRALRSAIRALPCAALPFILRTPPLSAGTSLWLDGWMDGSGRDSVPVSPRCTSVRVRKFRKYVSSNLSRVVQFKPALPVQGTGKSGDWDRTSFNLHPQTLMNENDSTLSQVIP